MLYLSDMIRKDATDLLEKMLQIFSLNLFKEITNHKERQSGSALPIANGLPGPLKSYLGLIIQDAYRHCVLQNVIEIKKHWF